MVRWLGSGTRDLTFCLKEEEGAGLTRASPAHRTLSITGQFIRFMSVPTCPAALV